MGDREDLISDTFARQLIERINKTSNLPLILGIGLKTKEISSIKKMLTILESTRIW